MSRPSAAWSGGTTRQSISGQRRVTSCWGSARPGYRAAMPSRSARVSNSSWAGPVPTTVSDQRPSSFTQARNSVSSPFGNQSPDKSESESAAFLALRFDRRRQSGLGNHGYRHFGADL